MRKEKKQTISLPARRAAQGSNSASLFLKLASFYVVLSSSENHQ